MLDSAAPRNPVDEGGAGQGRAEGYQDAEAVPLIIEYLRVFERRKWVVLAILGVSMLLGIIATMLMTPRFTASSRIEISREQQRVTKVDGLEPERGGQDKEFYQTQYELLVARSLAERVSRELKLANDREFLNSIGLEQNAGSGNFVAATGNRAERERAVVGALLKDVAIEPLRDSKLVDISYTSPSARIAAKISEAWSVQFIQASLDKRFESTLDARRFLEGRLAELRSKLEQSERDLVAYSRQKNIVALTNSRDQEGKTRTESTVVSASLTSLNDELAKATADRISAESRMRSGIRETDVTGNPALATLRQRRAELAGDYAKLMVQFDPGYPIARALWQQMSSLDSSIAREEGRMQSARAAEFKGAQRRETDLRAQVAKLQSDLGQQNQDSIQFNIFQRDADTNRQLYDSLLQRYKEIGVNGVGASNIAIIDRPEIPTAASSPRTAINLLASLLIGLVLASITVFALEQSDEGIKVPSEVQRRLGLPLLGSTPLTGHDPLELIRNPKSDLFESYLTIKTNLSFSTDHGVPRAFMVTSTRPAEGKSITAFSLASILARGDGNILLIDGDMRSPSISRLAELSNTKGLSNYLSGLMGADEVLHRGVLPGLDIMTAGPVPPSAAELLGSDKLVMLVEEMLTKYKHVVIDSPPLLGMADAPLIARATEGTIFVIESEATPVRGAAAAIGRLRTSGARVFGIVLSKISERAASYGYGYGVKYGYGYGENYTSRKQAEEADA